MNETDGPTVTNKIHYFNPASAVIDGKVDRINQFINYLVTRSHYYIY